MRQQMVLQSSCQLKKEFLIDNSRVWDNFLAVTHADGHFRIPCVSLNKNYRHHHVYLFEMCFIQCDEGTGGHLIYEFMNFFLPNLNVCSF